MIECDRCNEWFHQRCVSITQEQADMINQWFCPSCQPNQSLADNGDIQMPTPPEDPEESDNETEMEETEDFEVKEVIGMSDDESRYLLVWANPKYKDPEWIEADDCKGCIPKINVYRKAKGLNELPTLVGASGGKPKEHNQENWITMAEILKDITIIDRSSKRYKREINIEEFKGTLDTSDKIYVIALGAHCLVGLYLFEEKKLVLADGGNKFIEDPETQRKLKRKISKPITIQAIPFNQQKKIDDCGTSAALLAIELKKIYQTMRLPDVITVPRWDQNMLIRKEHKHEGKALTNFVPINKQPINRCKNCGTIFKGRNKSPWLTHERNCSVKMT